MISSRTLGSQMQNDELDTEIRSIEKEILSPAQTSTNITHAPPPAIPQHSHDSVYEPVTVIIAGIGLLLGFINSYVIWKERRTRRKDRANDLKLSSFRADVQSPIENALQKINKIQSAINLAVLMPENAGRLDQLQHCLTKIWPEIETEILRSLKNADHRGYVEGSNWCGAVDETLKQVQDTLECLVHLSDHQVQVQKHRDKIVLQFDDLSETVRSKIDDEVDRIRKMN